MVDWAVLLTGVFVIVAAGIALAALPAWRSSRVSATEPTTPPSRLAAFVTTAGGSLTAAIGVRFALDRGAGRTPVPVRTTLLAAATAVALVTSVVVFSGSLDHLLATPRLYGSAWDGQIALDNLNTPAGFNDLDPSALDPIKAQFVDVADHSGSVADSALFQVGEVKSGTTAIPAIGYAPSLHGIGPTIAEGHAPTAPDEVALGATTMARLHTRIGATIELAEHEQGPNHPVRVVGRSVLPGLAPYPGSDKTGLGVGALLSQAGWKQFSTDFQKTEYVFRWAPRASVGTLTRTFAQQMPSQLPLTVDPINHPAGVVSVQRLRSTPTLLASLVALLLAAAVANALVVTVRRRRRELAVLSTLGFSRGQILRTVLWQATTVGCVAPRSGSPPGSSSAVGPGPCSLTTSARSPCRSCRPSTCSASPPRSSFSPTSSPSPPARVLAAGPVRHYGRSERTTAGRRLCPAMTRDRRTCRPRDVDAEPVVVARETFPSSGRRTRAEARMIRPAPPARRNGSPTNT